MLEQSSSQPVKHNEGHSRLVSTGSSHVIRCIGRWRSTARDTTAEQIVFWTRTCRDHVRWSLVKRRVNIWALLSTEKCQHSRELNRPWSSTREEKENRQNVAGEIIGTLSKLSCLSLCVSRRGLFFALPWRRQLRWMTNAAWCSWLFFFRSLQSKAQLEFLGENGRNDSSIYLFEVSSRRLRVDDLLGVSNPLELGKPRGDPGRSALANEEFGLLESFSFPDELFNLDERQRSRHPFNHSWFTSVQTGRVLANLEVEQPSSPEARQCASFSKVRHPSSVRVMNGRLNWRDLVGVVLASDLRVLPAFDWISCDIHRVHVCSLPVRCSFPVVVDGTDHEQSAPCSARLANGRVDSDGLAEMVRDGDHGSRRMSCYRVRRERGVHWLWDGLRSDHPLDFFPFLQVSLSTVYSRLSVVSCRVLRFSRHSSSLLPVTRCNH